MGSAADVKILLPAHHIFVFVRMALVCWGTQGHALYYGPADKADEWFDRLGYTLPYRVNVADFILDISSGDVQRGDRWVSRGAPQADETMPS